MRKSLQMRPVKILYHYCYCYRLCATRSGVLTRGDERYRFFFFFLTHGKSVILFRAEKSSSEDVFLTRINRARLVRFGTSYAETALAIAPPVKTNVVRETRHYSFFFTFTRSSTGIGFIVIFSLRLVEQIPTSFPV